METEYRILINSLKLCVLKLVSFKHFYPTIKMVVTELWWVIYLDTYNKYILYSQWPLRWRGSAAYAQSPGCGSRWPDPGGVDWWQRTLRRLLHSPCLFLPLDPCPTACHPLALSSTPPDRSLLRPSRWPVDLGRLLFQQESTEKRKRLLSFVFSLPMYLPTADIYIVLGT